MLGARWFDVGTRSFALVRWLIASAYDVASDVPLSSNLPCAKTTPLASQACVKETVFQSLGVPGSPLNFPGRKAWTVPSMI